MSNIEVSEVISRRERDAFIKFQWQIYTNDPAWVPPLIIERKRFLDRKQHPFYRHGDAVLFLARKNGNIAGRIMASDDPNYNSLHQTNVGCFGLFECVDDQEVAAALFGAAASWLGKKGRTGMMGPIDYSTNYVCGLLIDGFQFPPTILTAHNPPYYSQLIEHCGFTKTKDWYAWWFADPFQRGNAFAAFGDALEESVAGQHSTGKSQKSSRRKQTASRNFQSGLAKELGFRAVYRSGD